MITEVLQLHLFGYTMKTTKRFCYECFRGRALKYVASERGYDIRLIRSVSFGRSLRGPFS